MKKTTFWALCLGFVLASANSIAVNSLQATISVSIPGDGRQVIKHEELPEAIKKILATDAYKGWSIKEAALITPAAQQTPNTQASTAPSPTAQANNTMAATAPQAAPSVTAATTAPVSPSYYELTLTKDKETKIVKFQKDGSVAK